MLGGGDGQVESRSCIGQLEERTLKYMTVMDTDKVTAGKREFK